MQTPVRAPQQPQLQQPQQQLRVFDILPLDSRLYVVVLLYRCTGDCEHPLEHSLLLSHVEAI